MLISSMADPVFRAWLATDPLDVGSLPNHSGGIKATSFIIGDNTLDTNEWAVLDGITATTFLRSDGTVDLTDDWTIATNNITLTEGTIDAAYVIGRHSLRTYDDIGGGFLDIETIGGYKDNWVLDIDTGDDDRNLTFSGSPTLGDWFDQSVKVAASPTFAGLELGATINHTLTNSSNDLIISNLNEDKDIIFSVNDGGTQKSFITIDSSKPALALDPGTVIGPLGILDIAGTYTTVGATSLLYFHPTFSGSGGISGALFDINITGTGTAAGQGIWITGNTNASQTSGTQALYGVRIEPDLKSSDQTSNAYGLYFKPTTLALVAAGTKGIYGAYIETPTTIATAGTVNQYGLYLKGWGTVSEIGGTINSYAIYSDGGNSVHAGNLRIGDTTTPTLPCEIKADSICIVDTQTPASNGTGTQGEIAWDADYIYVCTATNTWERAALTGGY